MNRKTAILIGTSGWSYKHWNNIFYPPTLPQSEWLSFYSRSFSITEINTSFYHIPQVQTIEQWKRTVPKDFIFCACGP